MSGFRNNKHYADTNGYHNIRINNKLMAYSSPYVGNNVIINSIRDESLSSDTHLKSIVISNTNKDGKFVEHAIARKGSFTHYNKDTYRNDNIKLNGEPVTTNPAVVIMTTWHRRDTFSSKVATTVSSGGSGESQDTGPSIQWFG